MPVHPVIRYLIDQWLGRTPRCPSCGEPLQPPCPHCGALFHRCGGMYRNGYPTPHWPEGEVYDDHHPSCPLYREPDPERPRGIAKLRGGGR